MSTPTTLPINNKFPMTREDRGGVAFLSCEKIPGLFIAAKDNEEIRDAIDSCLKEALGEEGRKVHVYTNGSLVGPTINTVVEITEE